MESILKNKQARWSAIRDGLILSAWIFVPELRRLLDWKLGFADVELLSAAPLLLMFPFSLYLANKLMTLKLPRLLGFAAFTWAIALVYGFLVAIVNHNVPAGLYALAQFVIPMSLGILIAISKQPFEETHARILSFLSIATTITAVYGIIQFCVAPPWDSEWLQNVAARGSLSFGKAEPFAIRVFSTLNSPGVYGQFLAVMLTLQLPRLAYKKPFLIVEYAIWIIAFGLSLDRTGWIMFAIGAIAYLLWSGSWKKVALVGAIGVAICSIAPVFFSDSPIVLTIQDRFQSFSDPSSDISLRERQKLYDEEVVHLGDAPLGHGLGVVGIATKLSGENHTIDSGFLARYIELGILGSALLIFSSIASIKFSLDAAKDIHNSIGKRNFAKAVTILQLVLLLTEFGGDAHSSIFLMLLWLALGLLCLPNKAKDCTGFTTQAAFAAVQRERVF